MWGFHVRTAGESHRCSFHPHLCSVGSDNSEPLYLWIHFPLLSSCQGAFLSFLSNFLFCRFNQAVWLCSDRKDKKQRHTEWSIYNETTFWPKANTIVKLSDVRRKKCHSLQQKAFDKRVLKRHNLLYCCGGLLCVIYIELIICYTLWWYLC